MILDAALPSSGELNVIRLDNKNNIPLNEGKRHSLSYTNFSEKLAWTEKTQIYNFPLSFQYFQGDRIIEKRPGFQIYLHGIFFIIILSIGAIFGVFFIKDLDMERKAAVYNFIMLLLMIFIFNISYG